LTLRLIFTTTNVEAQEQYTSTLNPGIGRYADYTRYPAHVVPLSTINDRADSASTATITNAKLLLMRLDVINATEQSHFTKSEKRIVRKEIRAIKADLKELRGARYVRTALIVVILVIPLSVFYIIE
jgi:hypothetical protein